MDFFFQFQDGNATSEDILAHKMNSMHKEYSKILSYLPIGLAIALILFLIGFNLSRKKCCSRTNHPHILYANTYEPEAKSELEFGVEREFELESGLESDPEAEAMIEFDIEDISVSLDNDSITSLTFLIH